MDRQKAEQALGARDRLVLDAARALDAANASGDAAKIRTAMTDLDAALRGQAQAQAEVSAAAQKETEAKDVSTAVESPVASEAAPAADEATAPADEAPQAAAPAPKPAPKPVVAMRGDDRPGSRKDTPAPAARAGKWGDRKDAGGRPDRGDRGDRGERGPRGDARSPRADGRGAYGADRSDAPRLGDAAFRAQRDALEGAQATLRKLAAQAHGEALTHLMAAWEKRDAALVPTVQELGARTNPALRTSWVQALSSGQTQPKAPQAPEALLRLEMAAEVPTPAEHLAARRNLQLQLLTRRNDPAPTQTWGQDAAAVMASGFDVAAARRLQNALKVLLKR